jgi:hypothetical protein
MILAVMMQANGIHYKNESKEIFLRFFKEPAESDREKHEGIYKAEYLKSADKTIQVILLDVRTFRNNLLLYDTLQNFPVKIIFTNLTIFRMYQQTYFAGCRTMVMAGSRVS